MQEHFVCCNPGSYGHVLVDLEADCVYDVVAVVDDVDYVVDVEMGEVVEVENDAEKVVEELAIDVHDCYYLGEDAVATDYVVEVEDESLVEDLG